MKIAWLNRGRHTHQGGDLIQLDATMEALRRRGIECVETGWDAEKIRRGNFDLCHIMHSNFDWSWGNYQAVMCAEKPYVLTPIYYPGLLAGINEKQLKTIVHGAELVLPFSNREAQELREAVGYFPYEAIPNGTDPIFHCDTPASEREGVLCVSARGENDKNIPLVKAACEKLGIPFTCVTGVPHSEMPAIYAKHRVYVNASESERMSLTVGEALCAGCVVVDNPGNRGSEWYGGYHCREELRNIDYWLPALYRSHVNWGRFTDANKWARQFTWDYVADRLSEIYRWVLK